MLVSDNGFSDLDFGTAPVTGLTRAHWVAVAEHLLDGSRAAMTTVPWRYDFGPPASVNGSALDELEGFARLLLLAAFRSAADVEPPQAEWYSRLLDGLEQGAAALADGHPLAWPSAGNRDQALVEACSVAVAVAVAPERFWHPLGDSAKAALVGWLRPALAPHPAWNNWVLFPAVIAAALTSLGYADDRSAAVLSSILPDIESWHLGDGWYGDGPGQRIDYYSAWSFNYYLPLIGMLSGDEGITRVARQRAAAFVPQLSSLVDSTGSPVLFGRSLTYRFAVVAPVWTASLGGDVGQPTEPGARRALASRVLRHFIDSGSISAGRLPVGWHASWPSMAQGYSSGASPLWAAKAFVGLLLPESHPLWSSVEVDPGILKASVALTGADGIAARSDTGADVAVLVSGGIPKWPAWSPQSRERDPLYSRLAYSSATHPAADGSVDDNEVALKARSGGLARRDAASTMTSGPGWVSSTAPFRPPDPARRWTLPYRVGRALPGLASLLRPRVRGAGVDVLSILRGSDEIRVIRVRGGRGMAEARVTGHAVGPQTRVESADSLSVQLSAATIAQSFRVVWGDAAVTLEPVADERSPFGPGIVVPVATAPIDERGLVLAIAVSLHRGGEASAPPVVSHGEGSDLIVAMADGSRYRVDVGASSLFAELLDG